jgi:predicted nucleotide-binding protein (sugar kinase/HSP70/actin superfamily)
VNEIGRRFRYFIPFDDIFEKAEQASSVISLSAQFGEGWLIAGEVATLARQGVTHVVSLQPFGCIANHIVGKGVENRLKRLYPDLNLLSLDFDSSVSEVNITNRLLLFINTLQGE